MRIAFWEHTAPFAPAAGGIANYIQHRAWVLGARGFEVWWANATDTARWDAAAGQWVERRAFPAPAWRRRLAGRWPALQPTWRYLARERKVDVFETLAGTTSWLPFPAAGPRLVLHCHTSTLVRAFLNGDTEVERHMRRFKPWAVRNFRRADSLLACSLEIALLEAAYYHVHPDRITVLPHTFSRQALPGAAEPAGEENDGSFLVVGNAEYLKALDLVARGFSEYRRAGGKGKLLVAGCAGLHELKRASALRSIKPAVEAAWAEHGPECLQFLGPLTKEQLARQRRRAVAVVHGSRFEALTLVAAEAFLTGCPLILSERTGWRALAERFQAARLVNPYDAADLAAAMREMEAPETRARFVRGGDALAAYLTSDELAARTAAFYRGVLAMNTANA